MPIIPLNCPTCGANLKVDNSLDLATCEYCRNPYIVKDAIINNYINLHINKATIQADTVNLSTKNEFDIKAGKLIKYVGEKQDVIIPNNVTEIGDNAFEKLNIKSILIPNGVTIIGDSAFRNCKQLKSIDIPDSVTEIYRFAFEWSGLQSINIPETTSFIGFGAFRFCSDLKDVKMSKTKKVGEEAFLGTPFWKGKCQKCGGELIEASFLDRMRGYIKQCKKCELVYK